MLLFTSPISSSQIPDSWTPTKFRSTFNLIQSLRAKYPALAAHRENAEDAALPLRPATPKSNPVPLGKVTRVCGNCNKAASLHTDQGLVLMDAWQRVLLTCFRTTDSFLSPRDYVSTKSKPQRKATLTIAKPQPMLSPLNYYSPLVETEREAVTDFDYLHTEGVSLPVHEATDYYDEDPFADALEIEDFTKEQRTLDHWKDKAVTKEGAVSQFHSTVTKAQHDTGATEAIITMSPGKKTILSPAPKDEELFSFRRSVFVENNPGFSTVELYSPLITERAAKTLLNVFLNKNAQLMVGSMRIGLSPEGLTQATCVNAACQRTVVFAYPDTNAAPYEALSPKAYASALRASMETFTWGAVAHGNNHAAKWFRERTVPAAKDEVHWLSNEPFERLAPVPIHHELDTTLSSPLLTSPDAQVQYLMEHQTLCRNSTCRCDLRLKELAPCLT